MPASRIVSGYIYKANTLPWASAQVLFSLVPGAYTPDGSQYPQSEIATSTNQYGYFETLLACNEDWETKTLYKCVEPSGELSTWVLPRATTPIDLSLLKVAGITQENTMYPTLASYVDAKVAAEVNSSLIKIPFSFGETFPKIVNTAFVGTIRTVSITIKTPFDGTPSDFYLGDSINPESLVPMGIIDASTKAEYLFSPVVDYELPTQLIFNILLGAGVTQGKGTIILGV